MDVAPPTDLQAPETVYTVFYVLFAVQLIGAVAWLVRRATTARTAIPLAALAGSVVIGYFTPPVYNHLTLVWFPSNIPFPFTDAFGMEDPSFDWMGYALFIGFGGYIVYERIAGGGGARAVWLIAAAWGVADLLYELPFLQLDLYRYYGEQPFEVAGFPLHWVFMNAAVPVVTGALIHALVARAPSLRDVALGAAVAPAIAGALLFIPILPVAVTLNADVPSAARWCAALMSMAVSAWSISFVARRAETERRRHLSLRTSAQYVAGGMRFPHEVGRASTQDVDALSSEC